MLTSPTRYAVTWEKLPDDFVLPDDPVDNINQPLLTAALSDSLENSGKLPSYALTTTNYGICATVNEKIVVKAPDWSYIPAIRVPRIEVDRSYTPQLQGDSPAVVMEFLSATDGGEYSVKPTHPPGKWLFYEQILAVPTYVIFALDTGVLEVYHLNDAGRYQLSTPDANNRYWIAQMNLFLGVWQGTRENRTGNWLRWWDDAGKLLLWGVEKAALLQERADRLAAQLRAAGIEPETESC
ncbi:MAG: Uma2 family endonuclease [Stenomitos rutilans HA7619-LM2]|jgi:Uma2 family endonuclease|nr:Uma2 family endonuclease [Stenomitos rutilans HA7619-LM2]